MVREDHELVWARGVLDRLGEGGDGRVHTVDLHDGRDRPRRELAVGQQLEDPATDGVSEDIEGVHRRMIELSTYISQS